jgi:paired amphipathic helix protein Sin3a
VTPEDAVEYLERVRATFAERPFIYNSFLAMFREFKSEKINTQQVIDRVKLLFKGYPDLIDGFNMFLPASYRIKVDRTEASSPSENTTAKPFSAAYEPCTSRSLL